MFGARKTKKMLDALNDIQKRAKPQTNADRIRGMSDEELARQLAVHEYSVAKAVVANFGVDLAYEPHEFENSVKEILGMLQQPAEEGA